MKLVIQKDYRGWFWAFRDRDYTQATDSGFDSKQEAIDNCLETTKAMLALIEKRAEKESASRVNRLSNSRKKT